MPLITLAGTPCTGKSTFAQRLAEALRASSDKEVVLINEGMPLARNCSLLALTLSRIFLPYINSSLLVCLCPIESLLISKAVGYSDSAREKVTRASLKSAVERSLTATNVVVLDSMNYIKVCSYLSCN